MAKNKGNDLTHKLSGRIGEMIGYRVVNGESEAFRRPGKRKNKYITDAQELHRERFMNATYYARAVNENPIMKAEYKPRAKGRLSVYALAVADFLKKPEVKFIKTENYHGAVGDTILIRAVDDFKVIVVRVVIMGVNGTVLEQGNAVVQPGGTDWLYTTTAVNPQLSDSKIIVSVIDLPGNTTTKELIVD